MSCCKTQAGKTVLQNSVHMIFNSFWRVFNSRVPYQFLITFFTLYSYQQSVCEVLFFAVSARVCSVVANCSSDEGVRLKRYAVKSPPQK